MNNRFKQLLEMAKVYRMPKDRIIIYIYLPELVGNIKKSLRISR